MAVKLLRIIAPDQPEVVPLNLLCIPDFSWAGNAIVQIGSRIWDDYWGTAQVGCFTGFFPACPRLEPGQSDQTYEAFACGLCRLQSSLAQGGDGGVGSGRARSHDCLGCFARVGGWERRQLGAGLDHRSCFSDPVQGDGFGTLALAFCGHASEPLCEYGVLGTRTRLGGDALAIWNDEARCRDTGRVAKMREAREKNEV